MNYTERLHQKTITHTVYESFFSIKSSRGSRFLLHNDVTVYLVIGLSNNTITAYNCNSRRILRYPYTSQKNISPKIICQKNISLNFLFPELTFVRNHTCQNEHLPKTTSARMNTCLKLHLPE